MANLTQNDIKKGVINGSKDADIITIDDNHKDKKVTVKAGNGNDQIDSQFYDGDLYAYAGMGSDIIYASQGNNYLYGESGTNIFVINHDSQNTVICIYRYYCYSNST